MNFLVSKAHSILKFIVPLIPSTCSLMGFFWSGYVSSLVFLKPTLIKDSTTESPKKKELNLSDYLKVIGCVLIALVGGYGGWRSGGALSNYLK